MQLTQSLELLLALQEKFDALELHAKSHCTLGSERRSVGQRRVVLEKSVRRLFCFRVLKIPNTYALKNSH